MIVLNFVLVHLLITVIKSAAADDTKGIIEDSSDSKEEDSSTSAEENDIYEALYAALKNFPTSPKPILAFSSTTTTTLKPVIIEDDDFDYGKIHEWKTQDFVEGYEIYSDGLQFKSKLEKDTHMVHIRIDVETAWTLTIKARRRNLELTIATWEKANRVHVKVPYGVMPEELDVVETTKYIDIFAPYGFIEVQGS